MRRITLGLLITACLLPSNAAAADDPPAPVRADEGQEGKDARILARIASVLPPAARTLEEVRTALRASDTREDRDVGFAARRLHLAMYGQATTAWVTIVAREGRVIAIDVSVPADAKFAETIVAAVKAAGRETSGFGVSPGALLAWRDPKGMTAWSDAVMAGLGGPRPAAVLDAPLRDAVAVLRDPMSSLRYGTMCGDGGDPPPGRDALEVLVEAKSLDGLRLALASPSPEGRVFAAEGLLRLEEAGTALSKEDRAAIEAVRAAPVPIEVCSGCEHLTSTAKVLLAEALAKK